MTSTVPDDPRITRLIKFFNDVIHDRRSLNSSRDGGLFIESICAQVDPAMCLHKLISSPSGLASIQACVRFDTSPSFINEKTVRILEYLQSPSIEAISSGSVLGKILYMMVNPPFFWDAFTASVRTNTLTPASTLSYAWLLLRLIYLPAPDSTPYLVLAASPGILDPLLKSPSGETRILGQKIRHALSLETTTLDIDAEVTPGGRHDNDFADHKRITIMPTADELLSQERPFLRTADAIETPNLAAQARHAIHRDNQFRLLREDMLGEIREEIQKFTGPKRGYHKGVVIDDLGLSGVETGVERKRVSWGIKLQCKRDLPQLSKILPDKRMTYLKDNRHFLRHGNMACLLLDGEPAAFPNIYRIEGEIAMTPATITLQLQNDSSLAYTLSKIKTAGKIQLIQLDSAVFAFEPFLKRLQEIKEIPLSDEILHWVEGKGLGVASFRPQTLLRKLELSTGKDLQQLLGTKKTIVLDTSQMDSLCAGLLQRVSLIQGPPGTGKSFIGALLAKIIHDSTSQNILVVCFTNHALDQFLEDLMDIGIPSDHMVRLGGKSTDRTKPLTLREQGGSKLNATHWEQINKLELRLKKHEKRLAGAFKRYLANIQKAQIMDHLEFASETLRFFETFNVPTASSDGMTVVGSRGKAVSPFYLLDRWVRGDKGPGVLQHIQARGGTAVWNMTREMRQSALLRWQTAILDDLVGEICSIGQDFNSTQIEIERIFNQRNSQVIKEKRIIACTTNGAATFAEAIQSASPGVVLVEEAGEILEAHILTAMGPQTEQLILIGDHQQLRPKCSYELSVDGGNGYDLNRSLFERLVRKGVPHITLTKQHRMRPEISDLIRHLTYPDLIDADSTLNRSSLRGFRDNVMFVNHSEPEIQLHQSRELRDFGATSSKQNIFEAQMILKCVRYLAQQGYGSDKIVVLTPYLGQLKLLREQLSKDNDPILNDLDKFDLVRAGLLTDLSSKTSKPSLRISTIDNYQGEESQIVLASMTRSNESHDIGFMAAPERLNVLISRARDALIMIGNAETFMHARKGKEMWRKLFDRLKEKDHIYEGFPVKCEKHPDRIELLRTPDEFENNVPDGGCKEPCGNVLKCGVHKCPSSCHQIFDHSKIQCMAVLSQKCAKGHSQIWHCHSGVSAPVACPKCERERKDTEKKARKALEQQQKRDADAQRHLKDLANVQEQIDKLTIAMRDAKINSEQKAVLAQKKQDLAAAKAAFEKSTSRIDSQTPTDSEDSFGLKNVAGIASPTEILAPSPNQTNSSQTIPTNRATSPSKKMSGTTQLKVHLEECLDHNMSSSQTEWQRQKDQEGAQNPAIDEIMEMVGLEDVKSQVLKIKSKVETSIRQGTDLKKERLGLVLLGNPGTGKTTVARHYAKVLTSLQILSGDGFIETTGSKLAHGGVNEVKDHLKSLENSDGGVYFIDEAYQLAEGHNYGGKTVLDYLLAEIENLTGKVVFVFAGYRKEMEKFFEHNPGFASRIPYTLHFEDYSDDELLKMLQFNMNKYYVRVIDIEGGIDGLYMRIAVRRLGRGRGRDGFGNARALENLFARIRERQSDRLTRERRKGRILDDYYMSKEDLIGPDPSDAILGCSAWEQLQSLTGLKAVKDSIRFLIDNIRTNYQRELQEKKLIDVSLNRVFLGSPGTGKTTVAKLYGRILADIGLLSNGEVVTKNPADFIGSVIGQSEANTKGILATTVGKVLIIDEAYMLYSSSGGDGGNNAADIYKTAVIDTLVAEVQSVPGEDRCVLLLGYEDQMVQMFQNVNPGLTRRFQLSDAFHFEDFSDSELQEILHLKLKNQELGAIDQAVSVAIDVLSRARNGLNFGNGGDVENLISKAKANYQARQSRLPSSERSIDFLFEPQDFDPDFERASGAETNLQDLFKDVVGCETIVKKLDSFLKVAKGMRAQGLDPRGEIPMNFIFKGPPGTGKTTTGRKLGQLYYDLGFLSHVEVVECSATDLVGQYVGQTGPKTIKQLERGLGKVLFIDEAYRLGEGMFAQEAINELVDSITKPKFAGKLVIILAGYDNDMNSLLRVNEGLSSRFADEIVFPSLTPEHCLRLLKGRLAQSNISIPALSQDPLPQHFLDNILELSKLPAWGNARDIQTLAKSMVRAVYQTNTVKANQLILSDDTAMTCIQTMLSDRRARSNTVPKGISHLTQQMQPMDLAAPPAPHQFNASTSMGTIAEPQTAIKCAKTGEKLEKEALGDLRDPNVSDAIWAQLQSDIRAAELQEKQAEQRIRDQEDAYRVAEEAEQKLSAETAVLKQIQAKNEAEAFELGRKREEARIRELEARALKEQLERVLKRQREIEATRKKQEQQAQLKLKEMGVCPVGFRWMKQNGGYRCSGGSHWVSDGDLGL